MNDYILLPEIIDSIDSLISLNLKKFLLSCREIDSNKYHLDGLRGLYLRNKFEFINIVDELTLRGFSFHTEKPNNLLPSGELEISSYILASDDQGRYQEIDYHSLGLAGLINRFQIQSDVFFHKIPLEGFKRINSHLHTELLEKELLKVGFKLLDINSGMVKVQENKKENENLPNEKKDTDKHDLNVSPSVMEVFSENIYRSFLVFCKMMGIQTVDQISEVILEQFANSPGVGAGKLESVKRKLALYIPLELESSVSGVRNLDLKEIFTENIFRTFLEFCIKKRIHGLGQITDKVLDQYAECPGVGIGKVQAVRNKIALLNTSVLNNSAPHNQSNKIKDIFTELRYNTFLDYCNKKGIYYIEEIREGHYDEYSSLRGVGVGKVHAVKEIVKQTLVLRQFQSSDGNQPTRLQDVFFEGVFFSFLRYCKKNNISTISEITEDHLTEYGKTHGVGVNKVEAVRQRLSQVLNHPEILRGIESDSNNLLIGTYAAKLDIENIFMEGKFTLFRVYCKKHGLKTLGELKKHHLEEFGKERMVGRKKVEEVRNVLSIYLDSVQSSTLVFESGEIYESIKNMEVQALLYYYGLQTNSESKLRIKDIEGKEFVLLREEFEPHLLLSLSGLLSSQKLPKDILSGIKKSFSERDFEIIHYRLGEEKTLEEVGSKFGITRERIRQIVAKKVRKIVGYHLKRQKFANIIRLLSPHEKYITEAEMESLIGEENRYIINIIKNEGEPFHYYRRLNLFLLDEEVKLEFRSIDDFIEELPDFFNINDYKQQVEEALESIGIEEQSTVLINHLLEIENYKKYGDFYSRTKLSINEVLSLLFKKYISDPLRIDEEGVASLQELAQKHLDYDMSSNLRAIDARIRDAKDVLLVDRSTFQYFDTENFDFTFIQKIEKYLNEQFKISNVINVEEVFQHFYGQLLKLGIKTKYHLYSLIRYYLDEKFAIGQGNTLNIFANEKSKVSVEDRLIAYMKKVGGICRKEALLEVISPQYKVDLAISHSDKIIPWGTNQAILVENIKLSSHDKNQLVQFINTAFNKGYTTSNYLYKEMLFDPKISFILNKIGVDEQAKLPSFIKFLLPKVKGHSNFLYIEGCELDSFEKVIELTFQSETSRQEIKKLAYEYGYKDMMASLFTKRLLEQGTFVEVDFDQLYPGKSLEISESVLAEVETYVKAEQGSQVYLSLNNLKGYRRKLPDIGFRWNPYLLYSVLQQCGYRQVKKVINDYRYDKIIVVREDSLIQTFEDLIIFIMENEYSGNMHEYSIYDFLVEKGILKEQEYIHKKVLPAELKSSQRLQFDDLGYLKIRQVR